MKYQLGRGGVQGQGKGCSLWECKRLMSTIGWQHAKVKSTKRNPPQKSIPKCHNALAMHLKFE